VTIFAYKTTTTTGWWGGGEEEEEAPEDDGISCVAGRGGGGGGGGDDGNYYGLPHVWWTVARPVHRIRHSEVVLVDAPLDDGQRKMIRRMGR
jgi:hypothetical protein